MSHIRPYRPADRDALYEVCLKTAASGGDATGVLADDLLWGDLFAVPYVERDPGLSWVVESEDGRTIGYIVSTDDTDAFEQWFRDEWWPTRAGRYARSGEAEPTRQDALLDYADGRGPGKEPNTAEYPAHLHIDLLPETQGQGLGRQLVQHLFAELGRRGVRRLHLGMSPENTGAAAFYDRLGFTPLPSPEGTAILGISVREG
ncbi:ribosomal protein S18 acetylase RimI-like enzyme [Microbacterium resistens]|uniref:Ribosomal protein S18 acetylase RimI-like enzyme n=1 Tax=Microbacterium resistens TaxID=156977 RepID=A0ABU1SAV3_9MICO|nr:GNAT family N-acetyltransferase [Microbacterium resistens]MDR6866747.1 ribosomal protein S18 acetylase RimI-like enzyme [Microbacterium resistens]